MIIIIMSKCRSPLPYPSALTFLDLLLEKIVVVADDDNDKDTDSDDDGT